MLKMAKTLISFNMRKRNNFINYDFENAIMMTSVVIFRVSFLTLILNLLLLLVQISNLQRRVQKCGVRKEEGCIMMMKLGLENPEIMFGYWQLWPEDIRRLTQNKSDGATGTTGWFNANRQDQCEAVLVRWSTCAPVVASSGFLSSLIRRKRGNLREMPFSGSTWRQKGWHH